VLKLRREMNTLDNRSVILEISFWTQ
jgi:hypothetical protein